MNLRLFADFVKSTCGMYVLHNRNGHICGFQSLITALNEERVSSDFILLGTNFYVFGIRNDRDLVP